MTGQDAYEAGYRAGYEAGYQTGADLGAAHARRDARAELLVDLTGLAQAVAEARPSRAVAVAEHRRAAAGRPAVDWSPGEVRAAAYASWGLTPPTHTVSAAEREDGADDAVAV